MTPSRGPDPPEAGAVVRILLDVLGEDIRGAYLYGSAVVGGLRPRSDVDVLAVARRRLTDEERRQTVHRLLDISGGRARGGPARPVELTIVAAPDIRPWRYPPSRELQYGEWLREELEAGLIPENTPDPDLATLLTMVLAHSRALHGPEPADLIDPVPTGDLLQAILEGVPWLLADIEGDEANVLLTLARIWLTLTTGEIRPKDGAAGWALARLPEANRAALARARAIYDGDAANEWTDLAVALRADVDLLVAEIDRAARAPRERSD
jgi:predicted nucleotidyltransferase